MAKVVDGIAVNIDCKISVTRESAERAMRIVEMYMQDHPELMLIGTGSNVDNSDFSLQLRHKGAEYGSIR